MKQAFKPIDTVFLCLLNGKKIHQFLREYDVNTVTGILKNHKVSNPLHLSKNVFFE